MGDVERAVAAIDFCVNQNATIDVFEDYFEDEPMRSKNEEMTVNELAFFKDASTAPRTAVDLSWSPNAGMSRCGRVLQD